MQTLLHDLRFGARVLRKAPGFTMVAVVVLALGIGANTAIFSVVNAILLRPLPFPAPERLVQVWHVPPPKSFPGMTRFPVFPANYLDWEKQNHVFENMAIYGHQSYNLTGSGEPESVSGIGVSPEFFSVLRVQPILGRVFLSEENQHGRGKVAVLSQAFWQTHFASDPKIIGRTISLDRLRYTVVGVIASKLLFPTSSDPIDPGYLRTMRVSAVGRNLRGLFAGRNGMAFHVERIRMPGKRHRHREGDAGGLFTASSATWSCSEPTRLVSGWL